MTAPSALPASVPSGGDARRDELELEALILSPEAGLEGRWAEPGFTRW